VKRHKYHYGDDPSQWGELFLPDIAAPKGLVVVIHGGYWRSQYGAELGEPLARDLAAHGMAAWNLEYRRAGNGGGWPHTFSDVLAGIDKLGDVAAEHGLGLERVVALNLSNGAVSNLLGGSSEKYPKRHKYVDPMNAVPLQIPVYAVHSTEDDTVPMSQSESYAGAAKAAGSPVQLLKVSGDHFALIDPKAAAYRKCRELVQLLLG
jgi:acetyl esterase/lipase